MKNLIRLTVEILERGTSRRARITAPTIAQALELAGDGQPERRVRVVFPIDPESFFVESGRVTTIQVPESARAA